MKKYFNLICLAILLNCLGLANATAQNAGKNVENKIRLGLTAVKTSAVGEGLNPQEFGAAIQNSLVEYLKAPGVEIVMLESKLASQIPAEAKEKNCEYVIYVTAAHKKGGGGFGKMFGAVAPVIGQVVPMAGAAGGMAGAIAGQVASTAITTAATMSSSVKAKDSLQMDLTINKSDAATAIFAKSYKSKAKSDGEDIISPLIEQMAQAVIDTATGKQTVSTAK